MADRVTPQPEIWRVAIQVRDEFEVTLPGGAHVVHVGVKGDEPQIWLAVYPPATPEVRRFCVRGTGHPIEDGLAYEGTFVLGEFVGHLFSA